MPALTATPTVSCPDLSLDPRLLLDGLHAGTAVVTATHRGTPVGLLLRTLAPVGPATGIVSFGLSGYSYAWPALERASHIGIHLIDPANAAEARLAESFARTSVDGFRPEVAWHLGPDDVALLDDAPRRAIAVPTQRVHVGSHVVVVARLLG